MCCIRDILIYYFSPIFYHPMQDKSNSSHPTNSLPTHASLADLQLAPISSLKVPFCQWIRCLPMEQRFLAVKIHLPNAAQTLKRITSREEPHLKQHTSPQRYQNTPEARKFSRKYEKNFLDALVLVSDGHQFLDHICFDFAFLECPERLFEVLLGCADQSSNATLGLLMKRRREWKSFNQNLYKLQREQMSYQLFLYLRQEIFANFSDSSANVDFFAKALEEEKKRKKEFSNHWKYLSEESRQRLLLLGHEQVEQLCEWLAQKGIYMKSYELDKEIDELLKLQKNEFCNRIFKCKLKKVLSPLLGYYQLVYTDWKRDLDKARKKRGMKYSRNERDYNSQQKTESVKQSKPYSKQYKEPSKQYKQGKRKNKKRKSNSLQSNQTNQTEHSMGKKQISEQKMQQTQQQFEQGMEISKDKQQTKHQINPQSAAQLQYAKKSQSTSSTTSTKLSKEQKPQKKIIQRQYIHQLNIVRLNDQLQQIADKISQEANQFHDRRVIAFQRIQFLLQYYNVPIKLFGSCASGIAVRNSDIDIAIDNSILMYMGILPENERIKAALQMLQGLFVTQAWITEIKFIKTAAIPLIKLTIDTRLPFFDPSIGPMYYELNREHHCGPINADITVETKNKSEECSHLGLISTNEINKWLSQISCLHSLIIILKEMFGRKRLNCTYQGGLNTFSMIVLIVAYIYHAKLQKQQNAAEVFEKVLKFYSQEFDQRERGVDLLNRESSNIYYIKNLVNIEMGPKASKQKADLQIKDPMNQQKNMTRNCYSFPQIKRLFQLLIDHCFLRAEQQLTLLLNSKQQKEGGDYELSKDVFGSRNVFIDFLGSMEHLF